MIFNLSPYIFEIGGFGLRYYSMAYLLGLLVTYLWLTRVARYDAEKIADFCLFGFLAVIIGGRLGYVFFYHPEWILNEPWHILTIWKGGMSIHGGILLVSAWVIYFVKKNQWDFYKLADAVVVPAILGISFAKIGNFMNGELWGRVTDVPWCLVFPGADGCRHPSQLYEAFAYFLIFLILAWCTFQGYRKGTIAALFLILLGLARTTIEVFWREPSWVYWGVTAGTWLSVPMVIIGLALLIYRVRR